jgi:glycosyltransferase 2 family protein
VVLATLTFPIRTVRWRIMLARAAGQAALRPVWQATAIGFMANNILPARGGELARAYVASRLVPVRFTTALGSLAVERVFDGLILVLLLAVAIADPGFSATATIGGRSISAIATWTGAAFVVILAVLFALVHAPAGALAFLGRSLRAVLPARGADYVVRLARHFIDGLTILRAPRDFGLVVLWSLVLWLVNGMAFYTGFLAFHLQGPALAGAAAGGGAALPFSSGLLLQGVVAIGVAIPSSPGFFGLFEYASRAGLGLYGVGAAAAVGFAVGIHLGWFVPITVIGLGTLARAHVSLGDLRGARREPA